MAIQKITLIGAGRVATQLGLSLVKNHKSIVQVYSRNHRSAQELALLTHSKPIDNISKIDTDSDLYIISVVDDAIPEIADKLNLPRKILVHTSGSVAMNAICNAATDYGVFYPLQTFSKNKIVDFSNIPICIEGSNPEVESLLTSFAGEISGDVRVINSEQRVLIHIAAVFANNFSNFMYLMAEEVLRSADVSFDILQPLINETVKKTEHSLPHGAQTGPAARGDEKIIEKHLRILESQPEKFEIYKQISNYILTHFKNYNQNQ